MDIFLSYIANGLFAVSMLYLFRIIVDMKSRNKTR